MALENSLRTENTTSVHLELTWQYPLGELCSTPARAVLVYQFQLSLWTAVVVLWLLIHVALIGILCVPLLASNLLHPRGVGKGEVPETPFREGTNPTQKKTKKQTYCSKITAILQSVRVCCDSVSNFAGNVPLTCPMGLSFKVAIVCAAFGGVVISLYSWAMKYHQGTLDCFLEAKNSVIYSKS